MLSDIRYACRTLAKSPGFAITAIAALALGIGANTAIFSVINATLLHPAGIMNPGRVVSIVANYDKLNLKNIYLSPPDFAEARDSRQMFEHAAVVEQTDYNYTGNGVPERLQGANVSQEWFDVFSAKPRLGRIFRAEEDQPNANHVVVLSYAAWQRIFGGDPRVLGRKIELNRLSYEVVGVMEPEFRWPTTTDIWVPMGLPADQFTEDFRFNEHLFTVARMKPGASVNQANALMGILSDRLRNSGTSNGTYAKDSAWGMAALPLTDYVLGDTKKPMLILLGAVAFVLLIACSNIAGLMLARASARAQEIAVRVALGAGRWDLIRQTMAESLVLILAGALAGLAVTGAGVHSLLALAPPQLEAGLIIKIDSSVLLFTITVAVLAGLLSGIVPAWQIARIDQNESLKEGGRAGTASRGNQRLRAVLITAEVALAVVLLAGAGLFVRSMIRLQDVSTGFQPRNVMTASLSLPAAQYAEPAKQIAFYRAVTERLANTPGVAAAAVGVPLPFSGNNGSASFDIEGRPVAPGDPGPHGDIRFVSPDYLSALGIVLKSGRTFSNQDRPDSQPVVLIDENLARQYWPNEDPVGKHLRNGSHSPWATIVGVVGHVKHSDLAADPAKGTYYFSMFQRPVPFAGIVIRTAGDPAPFATAIRNAVREVDNSQAVHDLKPMQDMVSASLAPRRFVVTLLGFFAATALLLAAVGLYGVISYSVAQRTQEIGLRMALGAQRSEVLRLVVWQGLRLTLASMVLGLAAALAVTQVLARQLFGVSPSDPLTFAGTATALILAALIASYLPAYRATRVDPVIALRYQ
jgi:predicted permease